MALPTQEVYPAAQFIISGIVTSDSDGSRILSLLAGETTTVILVFALQRSTTISKGSQLNSISLVYRIASGTLTSIIPTLTRITNSNAAVQTNTNIPLNAASPAFVLTSSSTLFNRPVNAITTPAFDNQVAGISIEYVYSITLVTTTASVIEFHGAEALYTTDVTTGSSIDVTNLVMTSDVPVTISHAANSAADDFTISQTGAFDASLLLTSAGTGLDAIALTASAVGSGIALTSGSTGISLNTTGPITLTPNTTATITHAANGVGDNLNITQTGTFSSALILTGEGIGSDAISLVASDTAGGITIQSGTKGNTLNTTGQTIIQGATFRAGTISGTTVLTAADSGTMYLVTMTGVSYTITLPAVSAGIFYKFVIINAGTGGAVLLTNGSTQLYGTIVNDVTSVAQKNASGTIIFAASTAAIGDSIEIYGMSPTVYYLKAITSTAGGIL